MRARLVSTLAEVLPAGCDSCLLIDFPRHRNSGDAAVWLGERAVLSALGVRVAAVAERQAYVVARLRAAGPHLPVLISGGGNFGDLYQGHQHLREAVLRDFRDRPVVQLAQSVWFDDPTALRRCADLISAHGDVTLLVRDARSLDLCRQHFDARIVLCPDFAFGLGPLRPVGGQHHDVVRIARVDKERSGIAEDLDDLPRADWLAQPDSPGARRREAAWTKALRLAVGGGRRRRGFAPHPAAMRLYDAYAGRNLGRAVQLLSSGAVIVTDRLHGHILCTLLGKPHVLVDDRHGKVAAFHELWTSEVPFARMAAAGEARRALEDLLREQMIASAG